MRITADEKLATRERILSAAEGLFRRHSFDATTTREIAKAAGIAAGTLFNYFASKEAIVVALAVEACGRARRQFQKLLVAGELDEALFAHVAAELRQLKPLRTCLRPLLEASFSPLTNVDAAHDLRLGHLEQVAAVVREHGLGELSPVALQLYWTLYTGVLAFWADDKSPRQEDTLALLDQSLAMYVGWLRSETHENR
jgi:AcrR family transcriptional regulator